MTNYTLLDNEVITSDLPDGAYRLYCFLLSMCYGEKDSCFPSQEYISKQLNKSVRTIQRNLKILVSKGLIAVKRRGSISNCYKLLKKTIQVKTEKVVNNLKDKYNKKYPKKEDTWITGSERNYNFSVLEQGLLGYTKVKDLDGSLYNQVCLRE